MQAYPDEIGKMDFAHRRDAFCGKFSVTDVFTQYGVPFTVLKPHVVHPLSPKFQENLRDFAAICRVVNGMKRFNLCLLYTSRAGLQKRTVPPKLASSGITLQLWEEVSTYPTDSTTLSAGSLSRLIICCSELIITAVAVIGSIVSCG